MIKYPDLHEKSWLRERYVDWGQSILQIAAELGCNYVTVWNALEKHGIPSRGKGRKGKQNGNWRGGRHVNRDGYVMLTLPNNGRALEHRLVMEQHLGRQLRTSESVHHINGVRDDNRIENLQLRFGSHGAGQAHRCMRCGSNKVEAVKLDDSS